MPAGRRAASAAIIAAALLAVAAPAQAAPSWCGAQRASDETRYELANGAYRFHAVYLTAADGGDRFAESAPRIQADALAASGLIERLYGRAFRFDMGTSCGPQWLDISHVRAAATADEFTSAAASPAGTMRLVAAELARAGFPVLKPNASRAAARRLRRNWIVWVDAPAPARTCGAAEEYADTTRQASNWNNYAGKVALVFRHKGDWCGANVVTHEVGHVLGARHCDDAFEDPLCEHGPRRGGGVYGGEFFDFGNDDYWDPPSGPPLAHWTVNLSRFVCPSAGCNRVSRRSS